MSKLVDRAKCQANRRNSAFVHDKLKFVVAPKRFDKTILREKYLSSNLSAAQIGEEFGLSKQAVLKRLRAAGVSKSQGRGRSKGNYRFPNPPYGHRVVNGRLELHPAEMRVVRLIVDLRERQERTFDEIAGELSKRGFVTRQGVKWTRPTVSTTYRRWAGKI